MIAVGLMVLGGGFALWNHRSLRESDATFASGSTAYDKVGGKFAASFAQPPATSEPMAVAPGDLPPVSVSAKPIDVR